MKKKIPMFLTILLLCTGCAKQQNTQTDSAIATMPTAENALVANQDETVAPVDVVEQGMTPIDGELVLDGDYQVTVDSSSSMFQIVSCTLHAEKGTLTADMTMSGTGYEWLFMGTAEQASKSAEIEYIPFTENASGEHVFTIPVTALDAGISCAAFSKNKQKWYDRQI